MQEKRGIDYFGHNLPFSKLHMKSALKVRRKIYEWFKTRVSGVTGKVLLDHGSTPDLSRIDNNCFIRWLLEDDATVYAFSLEEINALEKVFPGLRVVSQNPGPNSWPKVDYVISSAVIEHVGSETNQIQYVKELLSISNKVLLTTPNRYHWLEFHTKIPLLHWLPRSIHRKLLEALGMKFWSKESNLRLLSEKDLYRVIDVASNDSSLTLDWYKPRFLGFVSNLVVLISKV